MRTCFKCKSQTTITRGWENKSWHWAPACYKGGMRVHLRERQTPLPTHWAKLGRQKIFQGGAVNDNHKKKKRRRRKKRDDGSSLFTGWRLWTSRAFPPAVCLALLQGSGLRHHQISVTRQSPRIIGPHDYNASFSRLCCYPFSRQSSGKGERLSAFCWRLNCLVWSLLNAGRQFPVGSFWSERLWAPVNAKQSSCVA